MNIFETVAFFRKVKFLINQPSEKVSPFFESEWRSLLYSWWQPAILAESEGSTLVGLVQRVTPSSVKDGDSIILTVHNQNPDPQN